MTLEEILKEVEVPNEIGVYDESEGLNSKAIHYVGEVLSKAKLAGLHVNYHYGVSQLCFIEENANEVFKVPFDGRECEEGFETDDGEWIQSGFDYYAVNYTAKAEEIYDLAVEAGVDMFFAEISFCFSSVWKQHFVNPKENFASSPISPSNDSMKKATEEKYKYYDFDRDWIAIAIDMYGEDKVKQLLEFIDDYCLDDFHEGNYGFDRQGRPMLLDYTGFYG